MCSVQCTMCLVLCSVCSIVCIMQCAVAPLMVGQRAGIGNKAVTSDLPGGQHGNHRRQSGPSQSYSRVRPSQSRPRIQAPHRVVGNEFYKAFLAYTKKANYNLQTYCQGAKSGNWWGKINILTILPHHRLIPLFPLLSLILQDGSVKPNCRNSDNLDARELIQNGELFQL